jgi:hypothetical protein
LENYLQHLGVATREAIRDDLVRAGINIDDRNASYSIGQLHRRLKSLLGADATDLLMEQLKKEVRRLG